MTRFTTADVARLHSALSVLLRPLTFPAADAWGDAAGTALCALLDADGASLLLSASTSAAAGPAAARARWRAIGRSEAEFDAYERQFGVHDRATERMLALGLPVAHTWMLWKPRELERSELYNDYHVPARIHDAVGLRVRGPDGSIAGVCLHRERPRRREVPAHSVGMLRCVAPAFQTGIATWHRLGAQRAELARVLDAIPDALLLFDATGTVLHANPPAMLLTSGGPDGTRVLGEARSIAWALGALGRRAGRARAAPSARDATHEESATCAVRRVPTATGAYSLRGSLVTEQLVGRDVGVLVTVERSTPAPLNDEALCRRYALTPREVTVARLVADGLSNHEICERLGVSFFTARNHVERVLGKLGVPNRSRVGAILRAFDTGPS